VILLERIVLREIHLALVEPFRTAAGVVAARRVLLLELTDAEGAVAWSECVAEATPSYSPDTVDTCWLAIIEWLADRVLGVAFDDPHAVHAALGKGVRGHRMARAAIEMGTWAVAATKTGESLAALLADASASPGGGRVTPRPHVEAGVALGMYPRPDLLVEKARAALAAGYRRIRMKIEPGTDVAWVGAVRDALGPDAPLAVDANGTYSLEDPAHLMALRALDGLGLTMIEQPLAPDDLVRHAALQRRLSTPICLDESITSLATTQDMQSLGSARMVNVKPGRVGGLHEAVAIHDYCVRHRIPVWCGGMLETGIGRAYNVALASLPGFTEPGDLSPSARYWQHDIVTPEWTMDQNGRVLVPLTHPGIGVTIDEGRIDDLTVRTTTLRLR
jgi:O-succinylbenzoate synthase